MSTSLRTQFLIALSLLLGLISIQAEAGNKLLATSGVSQIEGAAGGGLSPWALIAGGGSRNEIGASAFATRVQTRGGYVLEAGGVALGLYDSLEFSVARWRFGLSDTVPGQSLAMDVFGLKWRVLGDAVFDADSPGRRSPWGCSTSAMAAYWCPTCWAPSAPAIPNPISALASCGWGRQGVSICWVI